MLPWGRQMLACQLARDTERDLLALQDLRHDVSGMLQDVPYWYRAILSAHHPWDKAVSNRTPVMVKEKFETLQLAGIALAALPFQTTIAPEGRDGLISLFVALRDSIATQAVDLPMHERQYLLAVVEGALRLLRERPDVSPADIRPVIHELVGTLIAIAESLSEGTEDERQKSSRLLKAAVRIANVSRSALQTSDVTANLMVSLNSIVLMLGGHSK